MSYRSFVLHTPATRHTRPHRGASAARRYPASLNDLETAVSPGLPRMQSWLPRVAVAVWWPDRGTHLLARQSTVRCHPGRGRTVSSLQLPVAPYRRALARGYSCPPPVRSSPANSVVYSAV